MGVPCPKCRQAIEPGNIEHARDLARCGPCGNAWPLREIVHGYQWLDHAAPPRGAWLVRDGAAFRVGASTRSWLAIVPAVEIVVLVTVAAALLYSALKGHLHPAFAALGILALGAAIPGLLILLLLSGGAVEVTAQDERGTTVTSGPGIRRVRLFNVDSVHTVREGRTTWRWGKHSFRCVLIEADRDIKFGAMLGRRQREFLIAALRRELVFARQ